MKNIDSLIYELIGYGLSKGLIEPEDEIYSVNKLLELFKLTGIEPCDTGCPAEDTVRELHLILEDMTDYALEQGILESDTTAQRDLFDTRVMGLITPPPSAVREKFTKLLGSGSAEDAAKATDFYYGFSKATNYIRTDRIVKDEKWVTDTEFGALDITINLSKPEKDPRDIAAQGKAKKSGYPACLLCKENEGYAGTITHPARQNHRIIPITLCGEAYNLQYSPYVYYNEHCIIFNDSHVPMKVDRSTFAKLLDFVRQFPHYTAGSNADLPIVGGSILSHDHFQGGSYEFPMVRAGYEKEFTIKGYENIHAGIIKWPLSTIRLQSDSIEDIVNASDMILNAWRNYTDEEAFIYAFTSAENESTGTGGICAVDYTYDRYLSDPDGSGVVPHSTITPIARMRGSLYEMDLVLRNNITTEALPMGVYHPHPEYHHIKKENIGLIEVMGLAILPARLKKEIGVLEETITGVIDGFKDAGSEGQLRDVIKDAIMHTEADSHADWAAEWVIRRGADNITADNIHSVIQDEIGCTFAKIMECAGVYKIDPEGRAAFMRFIDSLA